MSDERAKPSWYRQQAKHLRPRAAVITKDNQLRDAYLGLTREYEKLADL
jgi:hypothetical protein